MSDQTLKFVSEGEAAAAPESPWPALVMSGEAIDQEIDRLANLKLADGQHRRSFIAHPRARAPGYGLTPGIDVSLNVLLPGESWSPRRDNTHQIGFAIRGHGAYRVNDRRMSFEQFDAWNIPSMTTYSYENVSADPAVFLSYSDAPLLKQLGVYHFEELTEFPASVERVEPATAATPSARQAAVNEAIGDRGARVVGYEFLIDIDVVASEALQWPWTEVRQHLEGVEHLGGPRGRGYTGRHLVVLYNPATERRNGTTHWGFASIAQLPAGRIDIPHRHTSAAINYIFAGSGSSTVNGRRFTWKSGDIMLSAPGWVVHNHATETGATVLTVQDHPLQIALESLLWQETLKGPVIKLGVERGIQTNLRGANAQGSVSHA